MRLVAFMHGSRLAARGLGDVADEAAADAALAACEEWVEAVLFEGETSTRRRFPASIWVDVRRWPVDVSLDERLYYFETEVARIAAWLRRADTGWETLLAEPWPGHERGQETGSFLADPNATLRADRSRGVAPLDAAVGLILQEGIELGALMHRKTTDEDALRAELDAAEQECARLRSENERLRAAASKADP